MKQISRREMFKEMLSKDTIRQVATAWYAFSEPLKQEPVPVEKKESLGEKVRRLNQMHQPKKTHKTVNPNGKEG